MTPLKCVLIWCGSIVLFLLTLCVLFALAPEQWLYVKLFGDANFIEEEKWNNLFMSSLFILSAIIDCIIIASVAKVKLRKKQKTHHL